MYNIENEEVYLFDLMIIGNGFDIAAGLDTKYENFCEKIKLAHESEDYRNFLNKIDYKYRESKYMSRGLELFYINIHNKRNNFFVNYFRKISKTQWNAVEQEIEDIVKVFDDLLSALRIENIEEDDDDWCDSYLLFKIKGMENVINLFALENINNWFGWEVNLTFFKEEIIITHKNIKREKIMDALTIVKKLKVDTIKQLYNEFIDFTRLFSLYLNVFAHLDECKSKYPIICNRLLIYNYTDTAERILAIGDQPNVIYIHNKFDFCDNVQHEWSTKNIIFGIDDKVELKIRELNCFKKSNQRALYDSDACKLGDLQKNINKTIGVYGHSLNLIDLDSLRFILKENKYLEKLTIFYYDIDAKQDLIQNLKDILTLENYNKLYYSNKIEYIQSDRIKLK